jgi:hypothetical protein
MANGRAASSSIGHKQFDKVSNGKAQSLPDLKSANKEAK